MGHWTKLVERRERRQRKDPRSEMGRRPHAYAVRKYNMLETRIVAEVGEVMASTPGIEEIQAASVSSLMLFKIIGEGGKWVNHQHPPFQSPITVHTDTTDCSSGVATCTR